MASISGRAVTNPQHPRAFAVCDRCGIWYNHHRLRWERQWQGTQLVNLGFLVCERCLDVPQPQLKARLMPPDPVPIANPRPDPWLQPGFFDQILATEPQPPPQMPVPPIRGKNKITTEIDQPMEIEP